MHLETDNMERRHQSDRREPLIQECSAAEILE